MGSHLTVEQGHVFGVVQSRSIIRPNVLAFLLVKCFFVFELQKKTNTVLIPQKKYIISTSPSITVNIHFLLCHNVV